MPSHEKLVRGGGFQVGFVMLQGATRTKRHPQSQNSTTRNKNAAQEAPRRQSGPKVAPIAPSCQELIDAAGEGYETQVRQLLQSSAAVNAAGEYGHAPRVGEAGVDKVIRDGWIKAGVI